MQVAPSYTATVLYAWGDPISAGPAFQPDASNSAADQAVQSGDHHDGIQYFPLPYGSDNSRHGLLALNHEYMDPNILHPDGQEPRTAEKVLKEQAAHGVSIIEVRKHSGQWEVVCPSRYARRITGYTPMAISGPVAGSELVKTEADPEGIEVLGTLNNCAHGFTLWGTYLTCEENWAGYFVHRSGNQPREHYRYGVRTCSSRYDWELFDARFDAGKHPNEPNRFGWVVEIDPYDPDAKPVKRTTLGRFAHEGAWPSIAPDHRLAFYMGDDARFEYIYKFVTRHPYNPPSREANRDLLDEGTLYVARFNADGSGEWIALEYGSNGLTEENGFANPAEVLVNTRLAADWVGATKMDRPEWGAVQPFTKEVYMALTNNSNRTEEEVDAANPRPNNQFGHIIRWREANNDPTATAFEWDIFILCGDPSNPEPNLQGNINGDLFAAPDGLLFDSRGLLWIKTDISSNSLNNELHAPFGNNQMLAADPHTGEVRRFLTGPVRCEITGATMTPDGMTLFVNIQHPGEGMTGTADNPEPTAGSTWPDGDPNGRPRSATVVVENDNGAMIGK